MRISSHVAVAALQLINVLRAMVFDTTCFSGCTSVLDTEAMVTSSVVANFQILLWPLFLAVWAERAEFWYSLLQICPSSWL